MSAVAVVKQLDKSIAVRNEFRQPSNELRAIDLLGDSAGEILLLDAS